MMGNPRRRLLGGLLPLLLVLVPTALVASPGYVFMKDGFQLSGDVIREGTNLPEGLWVPKAGGFYLVDDGARRTYFSHKHVGQVVNNPDPRAISPEGIPLRRALNAFVENGQIVAAVVTQSTDWNADLARRVILSTAKGKREFEQQVTKLTPYWSTVGTKNISVHYRILTTELTPTDVITKVRREWTEQAKAKSPPDPLNQHLQLFRLLARVGWFDEADRLRDEMLKEFTKDGDKIVEANKELLELKAKFTEEQLDFALASGAHGRAQYLLKEFPKDGTDDKQKLKVADQKKAYQEKTTQLAETRQRLMAVLKVAGEGDFVQAAGPVLEEMAHDLNLDTFPRLEPFRVIAGQQERFPPADPKAAKSPEQLLALAVTGWLLGRDAADADPARARQLFQARQFLLQYLREDDPGKRGKLLEAYRKGNPVRWDVMAQLLDLLPPPTPEPIPQRGAPLNLAADSPFRAAERIKYTVVPPPEYHHQRPYPVLVLLPNVNESPEVAIRRWATEAQRRGFLLVIPQWMELGQNTYQGVEREDEAVRTVVRDVRRRFNVDADRIGLVGFDQAGTMAYDVGLAHPGLFSGVAVMSAPPPDNLARFQNHVQYLPIYAAEGDRRPYRDKNRNFFQHAFQNGYPGLLVEYVGRPIEFYPREAPFMVDWLERKKRARGLPELGKWNGQELIVERGRDNRFYWLGTDEPNPAKVAKMTARLEEGQNIIKVSTAGVREVSVWLSTAMVDFQQPVNVTVTPTTAAPKKFNKVVEPDMAVLLEDYFHRGDKRNLYVARLDFQW